MKINGIKYIPIISKNENNYRNNISYEIVKPIKKVSKCSVILASAFFAAAACRKADNVVTNDSSPKYVDINQANKEIIERINLKRELMEEIENEKFSWKNLPDYQKLTTLFYTIVAMMLVMKIFTGGSGKNPENPDRD